MTLHPLDKPWSCSQYIFAELDQPRKARVLAVLIRLLDKQERLRDTPMDFKPALRQSLVMQRVCSYIAGVPSPDIGYEYLKPEKDAPEMTPEDIALSERQDAELQQWHRSREAAGLSPWP